MDNRDLDKMIQDRLRDFRESPDPRVWDRVRASLDQQKKRSRLIPLWLRLGAAAAILAAGLFLLLPREVESPEIPAVSRKVSPTEAQEESTGGRPAVERSLPARNEDQLAGDETSPENGGLPGSPGSTEGAPTNSGEGKMPAAKGSGREVLKSDRLATADSDGGERGIPEEKHIEFPDVKETDRLAVIEEKAASPTDPQKTGSRGAPAPTAEKVTDSSQAIGPKKSIFEAIETQEAIAESESPEEKWSVGPSLAPVYFNSFGNGSPVSSNFLNNSKSGTVNMSYGLQVSYQLSGRLSLRSGIHRVDYGYNTDDVGFTSSPTARPSSLIRTISYSENSKNLVVHSTTSGAQPPQLPVADDISAPSASREGQMLQEFGYLEIPVEMQYTLLDRKLGINLIGGMSSLFLVENSISLQSGDAVTEIGEAANMNSLNFSTNLGLGFYYRLNPRFEINLQPMFKYQLNTFSETSGSFRPYSIGVYSGLNFRF